ncbi:hypothetical protein JHL18_02525 [Clostridium sp. YIM B02505]|uniref:YokE-like PH domain-containing protein n=1 Tax=Clostridium yunnanense TaxID=2800325 RepID=A0ABS1EJI8_9CLOT|nr:hypothetical protein [Clostridium yunnanense]MBK1809520.1 hypothetical protein [Clostridium yunnanense]
MADTSQVKLDIRNIVKRLGNELGKEFYEATILQNKDSRKFHGVSSDKEISLFVCTNELQEGKIKAGQRASIFEKCYWLSLSKTTKKLLIFTDGLFFQKFKEEYEEYLDDIEIMLYK